ncbi:MAG TPA: response regulator [Tepidisphaeraceae bacterium]|nr:response regulator [Tepidisphaeraceae bacterium]
MSAQRILLVDDEPYLTSLVSQALQKRGDKPEVVRDGNAGFAAARRERPDLIVTDFQMPGGDGLSMAKQLKQDAHAADIPLIMLSGRGHRVPPSEQMQTNIRAIVAKPFSMKQLLAQIDEVLAERNAV